MTSERTFTAEARLQAHDLVYAGYDNNDFMVDAIAAALTAAHERETALREELALTKQALTAESCRADVWKGSAETGRAALAEAQRERDEALRRSLQCCCVALAAERQKVTALRERLVRSAEIATALHSQLYPDTKKRSAVARTYEDAVGQMDALGLTAQPPQDAEPA